MGGAAKAVGGVVDSAVGITTGGVVETNLKDGKTSVKVNTNADDIGKNVTGSLTGGKVVESLSPKIPEAPKPIDTKAIENAAEKAAAAKVEAQKKDGINSTLLGGSTMADNSNLRKKKLLGE